MYVIQVLSILNTSILRHFLLTVYGVLLGILESQKGPKFAYFLANLVELRVSKGLFSVWDTPSYTSIYRVKIKGLLIQRSVASINSVKPLYHLYR